jgi:hypothetical protein
MHPALHYDMMQARVADLHHQAQRDAVARAARRARRARRHRPGHLAPRLPAVSARRVFTILGARST